MLKRGIVCMFLFALLAAGGFTAAQDLPDPVDVTVSASDGLELAAKFYPTTAVNAPAVLLLHMLGSSRVAWLPLIVPLREAGYAVLAVDMRGHGQTGGTQDWVLAEADVQVWLDWLKAQEGINPDALAIVGASIGSNLALIGCANDPTCVTAIALSPGLDYRGVMPEAAVVSGLADRSALLVASHDDLESSDAVKQMAMNATDGEIGLRLYPGFAHGTELLLGNTTDSVLALVIGWLDEHLPVST